jgi:single-stranded-DNA-specific exonuclease
VRVDLCLAPEEIGFGLIRDIRLLEPFGRGNERPLFALRGVTLAGASLMGARRSVARLRLQPRRRASLEGVFFGGPGPLADALGIRFDAAGNLAPGGAGLLVDVVFCPEVNDYGGARRIQLVVRGIRPAA